MEILIALATLTAMEIVLGIDNIVFIAILSARLPEHQQSSARKMGLLAALVTRLILLFSLSWLMGLTAPLFHWSDFGIPESWVHAARRADGRKSRGDEARRQRCFGPGSDPDRRRTVPDLAQRPRDPPQGGGVSEAERSAGARATTASSPTSR